MGKVVGVVTDIVIGAGGLIVETAGKVVETVGEVVDNQLGLDSIGNEVSNWGQDIQQVGKVLEGDYHERLGEIQDLKASIDERTTAYNSNVDKLVDKMSSLIAFHEIFKMATSNRLDEYTQKYGPQLDAAIAQYQGLVAALQKDFDFVIGLTEGPFVQRLIGSVIMIVGGIVNDMKQVMNGSANGATWKRLVVDAVMVIAIILAVPTGGASLTAMAGFIATCVGTFLALDGMYANGAATGAIMSMLDFAFNDVMHLDQLIGKDFDKFDKDNEDYAQMVMYTKLAIMVAGLYAAWSSGPPPATQQMSMNPQAEQLGISGTEGNLPGLDLKGTVVAPKSYAGGLVTSSGTYESTSLLGVSLGTYSDIYKAFTTAQGVSDTVAANKQYGDLKDKLYEDSTKLSDAVDSKIRKNFMKSYKDVAYFLQDQQEFIDRYLWGMTAQNMYVDPYGTTPVANIRFTPDKDTRVLVFGYEDMFDTSKMAGSRGYFNSIIYG